MLNLNFFKSFFLDLKQNAFKCQPSLAALTEAKRLFP